MHVEHPVLGGNFSSGGEAASRIKNVLKRLGIPYEIIKRVTIASYEAEMNIIAYADKGRLMAEIEPHQLTVTAVDKGPGIPDIKKALEEGFSTATPYIREMGFGAGMGLSNMKKAADSMLIESVVGQGTTVTMTFDIPER